MQTPEGRLKDKIKDFLFERKVASLTRPVPNALGFYVMHVPTGYGVPYLDFFGGYQSRFFALETKKPGEVPTARQWLNIHMTKRAKCNVWWGDDFEQFTIWWNTHVS